MAITPNQSVDARHYVRALITRCCAASNRASEFTHQRWPYAVPEAIAKTAVSAVSSDADNIFARALLIAARERSVIGKLPFRRASFNTRMLSITAGNRGYWTAEGGARRLSRPTIVGASIKHLSVAAIAVMTAESLMSADPVMEDGVERDLEEAVAGAIDEALLDPTNAGVAGERPRAITYDAPTVASVGSTADDLRADLTALFGLYAGDVATAALIMPPATALQISMLLGGAAADLGVNGGTLFGVPVATSSAADDGSNGSRIVVVDTMGVAVATDSVRVDRTGVAALVMDDSPTMSSATPIGAEVVSMWQTNSIALRAEADVNWLNQRPGSVAVLTGVDYAGGQS